MGHQGTCAICDWCGKKVDEMYKVNAGVLFSAISKAQRKEKWYCSPKCEHEEKKG